MKIVISYLTMILVAALLSGCTTMTPEEISAEQMQIDIARKQGCTFLDKGLASWYGNELLGNRTANGEMFVPDGITAAHKTLPFGTIVKVTLDNGKGNPDGVFVRINDRGPFVHGRIIDLSWGAAKKLGMMDTKPVHIYTCGTINNSK